MQTQWQQKNGTNHQGICPLKTYHVIMCWNGSSKLSTTTVFVPQTSSVQQEEAPHLVPEVNAAITPKDTKQMIQEVLKNQPYQNTRNNKWQNKEDYKCKIVSDKDWEAHIWRIFQQTSSYVLLYTRYHIQPETQQLYMYPFQQQTQRICNV